MKPIKLVREGVTIKARTRRSYLYLFIYNWEYIIYTSRLLYLEEESADTDEDQLKMGFTSI